MAPSTLSKTCDSVASYTQWFTNVHPILDSLIPALFALSLALLRITRESSRLRFAWTLLAPPP